MEDLNIDICKVLQEITNYNIESLEEMSKGFLLAQVLHQIDESEFSASDKSLNNWNYAKTRLEHFLETKGLLNHSLEFELIEIKKGDMQALVSALLQILAILAAFNPSNWENIISGIDNRSRVHLSRFLETLSADILEEIKYSRKQQKGSPLEGGDDIKGLWQRLEKTEGQLEAQGRRLESLKLDLEREQQEKSRLVRTLEEKDREIAEMQQIKTEALKLLESNYASRREENPNEELRSHVAKLSQEVDVLNEKLLEARSQMVDKDNEIDKLKLIQSFLEEKKSELEELTDQLSHFKKLADSLKKEKEVADSKLRTLEYSERNLSHLKELIKVEKQNSINLMLKVSEQDQVIAGLRRRLGSTAEKVSILKKQSTEINTSDQQDTFFQTNYIRDIEEENERLKSQIHELHQNRTELEKRRLEEDLRERESEFMRSRIKSLIIENEHLNVRRTKERDPYSKSLARIDPAELELNNFMENADQNESIVLEGRDNDQFNWSDKEIELRIDFNTYKGEDFDLLYTTIMGFAYRELLNQRLFAPDRVERNRDIFKPFAITSLLAVSKE